MAMQSKVETVQMDLVQQQQGLYILKVLISVVMSLLLPSMVMFI